MKLKSFIGACIACTAIAVMAVSVHAETYALGGSNGHADGTEQDSGGDVNVPVVVSPDESDNGNAVVNGYIMTFTYNPQEANPVESPSDADSPYATEGEAFAKGIIVSGVKETTATEHTLIVAWASAEPVTVTEEATPMANVKFHIEDESLEAVDVQVALKQVANSDTEVKTEQELEDQVVHQGEIDLVDFLYGDVNGDGSVNTVDTALLKRYTSDSITLEELESSAVSSGATERAKINADEVINTLDTALLKRYTSDSITYEEFLEAAGKNQ